MAVNKVVFGTDTLMDITDSTVTPETLMNGIIAYAANGDRIIGAVEAGEISQMASGTFTPTVNYLYSYPITVSGLGFEPKYVFVMFSRYLSAGASTTNGSYYFAAAIFDNGDTTALFYYNNALRIHSASGSTGYKIKVDSDGFTLYLSGSTSTSYRISTYEHTYIAIG